MGPKISLSMALVLGVALVAGEVAAASWQRVPEGFDQYAVFMQNGLFDWSTPHPEVPDCFASVCDGQYFQEVVMGRSPAQILDEQEAAKAFFRQGFGLDVDDPANASRLVFRSFMFDPRVDYRLYTLGGAKVPPQGWEVRDGGHLVAVIDPAGIELGGEHAGEHAPAGSLVLFGNYNVLITHPNGKKSGELVLRYRSSRPMLPAADGSMFFACDVEHPEWGSGLAQGVTVPTPRPDGLTHANVRTVLTFPGLGGGS